MAKKEISLFESFNKTFLDKISNTGAIIEDSPYAKVDDWISTGNYILNAQMSGSIFGGLPTGRITVFAGGYGTGKTFLALNSAREAQLKGYDIIWIDTEGALTIDMINNFKINPRKFRHEVKNTTQSVTTYLKQILDHLSELKNKKEEYPKLMIIIDSVGNLSTDKEMGDAATGSDKIDMTRAKEIKKMFRVITADVAKLQIPVIAINHTYSDMGGMYARTIVSGGSGITYNASLTLILTKSQMKEGTEKTGIIVTTRIDKSRFTKGNITVKTYINFNKGMNPYIGLEEFFDWENIGIAEGKTDENGNFVKMIRPRGFVCKHLNNEVIPRSDIFNKKVFTPEILDKLNTKISGIFKLPSSEQEDELFNDILEDIDEKN